jgi:phycocyanobilin:ferredoxin oxidoreductase
MTNLIWERLIEIQKEFENQFDKTGQEIQETGLERFNWYNKVWTSDRYRRAHIDVVDARETKGLWMMHCCVFPHIHNPAPIFGFDVVAGRNKITGCFHDFSPAGDDKHPLIEWFAGEAVKLQWNKIRKLPDWAERIFTESMISAGNVSDETEISQISKMAKLDLEYYLHNVGITNNTVADTTIEQNYYCDNQRQNPHTPKVMTALGLNAEDVEVFIKDCLFPKIGGTV